MIDKEGYHIEKADTAFALQNNPMYFKCRPKEKNYDQFGKDLREKGLHYAVRRFPVSPKVRFRRAIMAVLPNSAIKVLKDIRSKIR